MKLLDEKQALEAIRALLETSDTARLAVAFWGAGAIDRLGLNRPGLSAQILCNLDSGACNPAELRKMRELPGVTTRSHPALHAKVYWTPEGAVLGSSNASANGLALEGDAVSGWAEANVGLADLGVLQEIEVWFDRLFAAGYVISDADLDRAEQVWQERAKMAPPGARLVGDLVSAYRNAPGHLAWKRVKLAYWQDPLTEADETRLAKLKEEKAFRSTISAYSRWSDRIAADDWVLDFDLSAKNTRFTGLWKALPDDVGRSGFRLVYQVQQLQLPSLGRLTLGAAGGLFASIAPAALARFSDDGGRNAVVDLPKAMDLLSTAQAAPTDQAFTHAMWGIYKAARDIGYHPTAFLQMLTVHGGKETAHRLIPRNNATSGFTELWKKGRLDLSVEALILKPEWKALFSVDEQNIARKRLVDYGYNFDE